MQIADEIRQRAANLETIFVIIYFFVDEEYKKWLNDDYSGTKLKWVF